MSKTAHKAPALLAVATFDPDMFFKQEQELALVTDSEGNQYITAAGLEASASPFTGEIVEDSGIPVKVALEKEHALELPCETCDTSIIMDAEQAAAVHDHKISCVVCGSEIEYQLEDGETASSEDDDQEGDDTASTDDDSDNEDSDTTASEDGLDEDDLDDDEEDRPLDRVEWDDDDDDEEASSDEDGEDTDLEASDDNEDETDEASTEDDDYILIVETAKRKKAKTKVRAKKVMDDEDSEEEGCDDMASTSEDTSDTNTEQQNTDTASEDDSSNLDTDQDTDTTASVEVADVLLASVVSAEDAMSIVALADDKAGVMVGDICVATITDQAANWDVLDTVTYQKQLGLAVKKVGLEAALKEAGFDLTVIKADTALANAADKGASVVASAVKAETDSYQTRLRDCMDVVAAGAACGMFAKSGAGELASALEAALTGLNIGNARAVTMQILTKSLPGYSNGLIETAHALTLKPDEAIASLREQIEDMGTGTFNYKSPVKDETASVEEPSGFINRITRPAKASETASVVDQPTQPTRRFAGLKFNR